MMAQPATPTAQETSKVWTGSGDPAVVLPVSFPVELPVEFPVAFPAGAVVVELVVELLVDDELEDVEADTVEDVLLLDVSDEDEDPVVTDVPLVAGRSEQPERAANPTSMPARSRDRTTMPPPRIGC